MEMNITPEYYLIIPLLTGFVLDSLIGDPNGLPHPIRWFGYLIGRGEKYFNTGKHRFWKGALLTVLLTFFVWGGLYLLMELLTAYPFVFIIIASVGVFYGIANRSLIMESLRVIRVLEKEGLEAGRQQLSFIVGRDTQTLNPQQIRQAVLETLAENLSDGVIAPLFYYALGGIPALFAYKMVNTLDSMTGYKNERYEQFGKFAARLDDVLNFIPARLTALIMIFITFSFRGLWFIFKYGHKHSSPNAGYPEAALAGILNCRFGGPNRYHGQMMDKPYIGNNDRKLSGKDVYKGCAINAGVSVGFVLLVVFLYS